VIPILIVNVIVAIQSIIVNHNVNVIDLCRYSDTYTYSYRYFSLLNFYFTMSIMIVIMIIVMFMLY